MAPKKEQAAAVTPATVLIGLYGAEPSQQLQALSQLAAATTFSQVEVLQCGIPAKLVSLLQQPDKSVKLLACRQLAIYAGTAGLLQQATASLEVVQLMWTVLSAYYAAEAAITDALAEPAAAKAAQSKKQQAAKDIVEPDEWLSGPSKYLLDAALRTLCSLLGSETSTLPQPQWESADITADPAAVADAMKLHAWVAEQDVNVLVCLARHPSGRVQMRACRLAHQLAREPCWADAFATTGGAAAALTIGVTSTPSNPAPQLMALRLLHRLADVSITAAAVVLTEHKQAADALITQILEAGAAPAAQGKGKAATNAAETGKVVNFEVTAVQLAAAELLALLCYKSICMSQHVVASGGLAALQALLPEPPAAPLTAEQVPGTHRLNSSGGGVDEIKSPHMPTRSTQPTPRPGGDATRQTPPRTPVTTTADAKQGTLRGMTPAAGNTARSIPQTPHTPHAGSLGLAGGHDITAAAELLAPEGFHVPAAKTAAPDLQARVLHILAAILQHQELVQPLVWQGSPGLANLLRLLLHMFAPAPVSEQPVAVASEVADVIQPAAAADASGNAAAAAAAAARAPTPNKAAGSTTTAAKGAAPAAGGRKSGVGAAEAAAAAGAATPRKGAVTAAAGAAGKDVQKVEPPPLLDPLAPPYSAITKAAALDCLAHLVRDQQTIALLAAQQVSTPQAATQPSFFNQSGLSASEAAGAVGGLSPDGSSNSSGATERPAESGVSMVHQMLEDLLMMGSDQDAAVTSHSICSGSSNTAVIAPGQQPGSTKDGPACAVVQHKLASMLDGAAAVLAELAKHLEKQLLLQLPMLPVLKALAKCWVRYQPSLQAHQAVARALLQLPEALLLPAARPPLPSPPLTPPAPPLPTNQFAWDALDRPSITDGVVVLSSA